MSPKVSQHIAPQTIKECLSRRFKQSKTKLSPSAIKYIGICMNAVLTETILRAGKQAISEDTTDVSADIVQKRPGPLHVVRTFTTHKKHYEPTELCWQWQVKNDPSIYNCSLACISKLCPKPSFFPRFRKKTIPADICSCVRKPKQETWSEFFRSILVPESRRNLPPLRTCRKLMALRQDVCLDDWECCQMGRKDFTPKEWYGQGVVHAIMSSMPEVKIPPLVKSCAPPDHMIPRCVLAKKGAPPPKTTCYLQQSYKEPFSDIKGFSTEPKTNINKYVCRFKCHDEMQKLLDKSSKLTCSWYDVYKDVGCPMQMYTRFKSVSISPKGQIKPKAASEKAIDPCNKVEIKKGICRRQTLLRPRGVRNFSTSTRLKAEDEIAKKMAKTRRTFPQPKYNFFDSKELMRKAGFEEETDDFPKSILRKPHKTPTGLRKYEQKDKEDKAMIGKTEVVVDTPKSLSERLKEKVKPKSKIDKRKFSTSTITYKDGFRCKKDDGKKAKPKEDDRIITEEICSGCPGIAKAMQPKKAVTALYSKCVKRGAGKCRNPNARLGPNDPPINNPYQKCRAQYVSKCNQPRPVVVKKERTYRLPCEEKRKYHSSAYLECAPESDKNKRKLSALEMQRGSCPCFKQKPNKEEQKGLLCKIASMFGIGCGKKKCM